MALGQLASLGLGSSVLTTELIDKLKKADEDAQVKLYTDKIEKNTAKQKTLTELNTKLLAFQTAASSLGDATAFQKRSVTGSKTGDSAAASLSAADGVAVQKLSVSVTQLAEKDVFQSGGFSSQSARVLDGTNQSEAKFTILQDGKSYQINVKSNDTFEDLVTRINDATDGKVVAKMVNTGEANNPYRFTLSSKDTGEKNKIRFVDGIKNTGTNATGFTEDAGATALFRQLGWSLDKKNTQGQSITNAQLDASKNTGFGLDDPSSSFYIKHARDSKFTLDGVSMIRSSNEIKDIGAGLTLTLKDKGDINFDVKQDTEELSKAMEDFVQKYNDLMPQLDSATKYDVDTKVAGDLQGISAVTSIRSTVVNTILKTQTLQGEEEDANGKKISTNVAVSILDYGISISEKGVMSFSKSKFDEKIAKDVDFAEKFFAGTSGFENLNHNGAAETFDGNITINGTGGKSSTTKPWNDYMNEELGKNGSFQIIFNDTTYDLSKKPNSNDPFEFKGTTAQDRIQELVDHINSFNIADLKVSYKEMDTKDASGATVKKYALKFDSDNGSDFEIKGRDDSKMLEQLGLKNTKITPQIEIGTGIFANLKTTLEGMTSTRSGKEGSLTALSKEITNENKKLEESKKQSQERIDTKYDTMTEQWIAYDRIIAKLKSQGNYITQMVNAQQEAKG